MTTAISVCGSSKIPEVATRAKKTAPVVGAHYVLPQDDDTSLSARLTRLFAAGLDCERAARRHRGKDARAYEVACAALAYLADASWGESDTGRDYRRNKRTRLLLDEAWCALRGVGKRDDHDEAYRRIAARVEGAAALARGTRANVTAIARDLCNELRDELRLADLSERQLAADLPIIALHGETPSKARPSVARVVARVIRASKGGGFPRNTTTTEKTLTRAVAKALER